VTANHDEIREKFSAAYDNELSAEDKALFDKALQGNAELKAEYDEFAALLRSTHALADEADELPTPDLVRGVQARLRARSGGKFFRDRFSEESGPRGVLPILLLSVMLLLVTISWFAMQYARELEPTDTAHTSSDANR